jgi:hypothetical protein
VLQIVQRLMAEKGGPVRPHLKMTPMILTERERTAHQFVNKNALVRDPLQEAVEHKLVNPWTEAERKLFLEKFTV